MSTFKGNAKSLSEQYVFYQRLKTDRYPNGQLIYPKLGQYVQNASLRILDQTRKYSADASAVRAQAQAEFAKEKALLQQKFGVAINFDYYRGSGDFKEIIDALNACLNLKEVYQRNIQVIKNTEGMKAVFSWYPTYFMKAWQEFWPRIKSNAEARFMKNIPIGDALAEVLDRFMPQICERGIQLMFDGPEVESSLVDKNLKSAYAALVSQIGSIKTEGSVANQIYKAYQLDELKQSLIEEIEVKNKKIYAKQAKPKVTSLISKSIHSRGGFTLEAVETAIFQMVASGIDGGAVRHSGSKGIKADNILSFSIDPEIISSSLEKAGANREENIQALSELGNKLSKLDDGFIVYSSDKNYSLNANFKGFNAGSTGANAASFLNSLPNTSASVSTLIGAIQQLGKGAMLEGRKAEFEMLIAQDVAYMLFDDFTTIGNMSSGGNAIHIMNLNGIMMPLSVVLTLLADAIESINEDNIRRIVNVTIKAPAILYPTMDDQKAAFPDNPHAAWEVQKQYALDNTQITAKFMKDFKSLITALL